MKSVSLFLFIGLILYACRYVDETRQIQTDLTIAEVKLQLARAKDQNDLIKKIDMDEEFYTLHFEEGNPLNINARLLNRIDYDSALWLATVQFQDNTSQSVNFLGTLNINERAIVLNPYLTSPLTAFAQIETPVKGKFRVVVKGKPSNGISIEKFFSYYGDNHHLPILGLYENYNNEVEFVFMNLNNSDRCSKIIYIPTAIIQNKPKLEIEIIKNELTEAYHGLYIITDLKIGLDQTGEIRWYYNGDGASFFGQLANGNLLTNETTNHNFLEITVLGQRVKKYNVPDGLHHEIVEMPSGNFLVASHSSAGRQYEDVLVEIDRNSGNVVKSWDFNLILDPLRTTLPDTRAGDWLHINSLYYDESDNSIVISGRSQCAVVKIDYVTGVIKWILGNHNQWASAFQPFLLKPVDDQGFELDVLGTDFWNYGQHAIHRVPGGNLLLYDNGDYRGFYDDANSPQTSYTRIVEYKINESKKTVELVWQFDNNKSVFTKFTGYTQPLVDTRLIAYMWATENSPRIVEINSANNVVYEATINQGKISYYRTIKVDFVGR